MPGREEAHDRPLYGIVVLAFILHARRVLLTSSQCLSRSGRAVEKHNQPIPFPGHDIIGLIALDHLMAVPSHRCAYHDQSLYKFFCPGRKHQPFKCSLVPSNWMNIWNR